MAFGNYYPYFTQQYQAPAPQVQQIGGITWVQGEAGAKAFAVRPGESAFLMDSENPMAYLKSADMTGMPSMRYYSVTELTGDQIPGASQQASKSGYATTDEVQALREDITKLRKAIKTLKSSMEVHDDE